MRRRIALIAVIAVLCLGGLTHGAELERTNPKDGAQLIYIGPGPFLMGLSPGQVASVLEWHSDWDKAWFTRFQPQRTVSIGGYWISKFEITVAQYREFCKATARKMPAEPPWGWHDNHPIVNVTWLDAMAYARWAGGRLPTEEEWEKAARGTDGRLFTWGNQWQEGLANVDPKETSPVGSYPSDCSPYGCMDMAGNAWEWCADWWDSSSYRSPTPDQIAFCRVIRSGCWDKGPITSLACYSKYADQDTKQVFNLLGFRLVVDGDGAK